MGRKCVLKQDTLFWKYPTSTLVSEMYICCATESIKYRLLVMIHFKGWFQAWNQLANCRSSWAYRSMAVCWPSLSRYVWRPASIMSSTTALHSLPRTSISSCCAHLVIHAGFGPSPRPKPLFELGRIWLIKITINSAIFNLVPFARKFNTGHQYWRIKRNRSSSSKEIKRRDHIV